MVNVTVNFNSIIRFTDEQFYQLCRDNPDVKFERNAKGEITILSPTGGTTGNYNCEIAADFAIWNRQTKLGVCFDSSTCFKLSNSAQRSPDVAWIKQERWDALTPEQKEKFPPIAPDFVLELMSPSDRLEDFREKMQEYIENGVRLGWLINRQDRQVEIYRPEKAVEVLNAPETLSGEDILPGFVLNLKAILSSSS
ncbi:Uma2 family endonuclease [Capilliphycus salinus ALCB114379]|uniref:Uma2 family endonuclease n=1 Tax=Capilliphycus salinus TaxID=2768948 RepID=UPI0039A49F88